MDITTRKKRVSEFIKEIDDKWYNHFEQTLQNDTNFWDYFILYNTPEVIIGYKNTLYIKYITQEYNKHLMAYRIQQAWNKALSTPYCIIGYNKINRDYDSLVLFINSFNKKFS